MKTLKVKVKCIVLANNTYKSGNIVATGDIDQPPMVPQSVLDSTVHLLEQSSFSDNS